MFILDGVAFVLVGRNGVPEIEGCPENTCVGEECMAVDLGGLIFAMLVADFAAVGEEQEAA